MFQGRNPTLISRVLSYFYPLPFSSPQVTILIPSIPAAFVTCCTLGNDHVGARVTAFRGCDLIYEVSYVDMETLYD